MPDFVDRVFEWYTHPGGSDEDLQRSRLLAFMDDPYGRIIADRLGVDVNLSATAILAAVREAILEMDPMEPMALEESMAFARGLLEGTARALVGSQSGL